MGKRRGVADFWQFLKSKKSDQIKWKTQTCRLPGRFDPGRASFEGERVGGRAVGARENTILVLVLLHLPCPSWPTDPVALKAAGLPDGSGSPPSEPPVTSVIPSWIQSVCQPIDQPAHTHTHTQEGKTVSAAGIIRAGVPAVAMATGAAAAQGRRDPQADGHRKSLL